MFSGPSFNDDRLWLLRPQLHSHPLSTNLTVSRSTCRRSDNYEDQDRLSGNLSFVFIYEVFNNVNLCSISLIVNFWWVHCFQSQKNEGNREQHKQYTRKEKLVSDHLWKRIFGSKIAFSIEKSFLHMFFKRKSTLIYLYQM